jgi:lipoprotein-anchoring transpeptidase ErfK/SrfK
VNRFLLLLALACGLGGCASRDRVHTMRVSVPDQQMALYKKGVEIARYPVSTGMNGIGDQPGSRRTPPGQMEIAQKIGGRAPAGMKFKSRRPTGEIVPPNSPGRDPIVSRILWLRGTERQNKNAHSRTIYIHGTAEERRLGQPVSYGCIRMSSRDVINLYDIVGVGARVEVTRDRLPPPPGQVRTAAAQPAPSPTPRSQL